jgi:hypothetical protein
MAMLLSSKIFRVSWMTLVSSGADRADRADRAGHAGNGNHGIVVHVVLLLAIKKAPVLFRRGFGSDDAIVKTYARTSPEARQGFAVFAVRLVVVIMARTYAAGLPRRQRVLDQKFASTRLNRTPLSRHKLTHEPSQSF